MQIKILSALLIVVLLISCSSEKEKKELKTLSKSTLKQNSEVKTDSFYCYAKGILVDNKAVKFQYDKVNFLRGEEAHRIMVEDGMIDESEWPPNGIYIQNKNEKIETVKIDSTTNIIMMTFSNDDMGNFNFDQKISLEEFIKLLSPNYERNYINFPFLVMKQGTEISEIKEVYIP